MLRLLTILRPYAVLYFVLFYYTFISLRNMNQRTTITLYSRHFIDRIIQKRSAKPPKENHVLLKVYLLSFTYLSTHPYIVVTNNA